MSQITGVGNILSHVGVAYRQISVSELSQSRHLADSRARPRRTPPGKHALAKNVHFSFNYQPFLVQHDAPL